MTEPGQKSFRNAEGKRPDRTTVTSNKEGKVEPVSERNNTRNQLSQVLGLEKDFYYSEHLRLSLNWIPQRSKEPSVLGWTHKGSLLDIFMWALASSRDQTFADLHEIQKVKLD